MESSDLLIDKKVSDQNQHGGKGELKDSRDRKKNRRKTKNVEKSDSVIRIQ